VPMARDCSLQSAVIPAIGYHHNIDCVHVSKYNNFVLHCAYTKVNAMGIYPICISLMAINCMYSIAIGYCHNIDCVYVTKYNDFVLHMYAQKSMLWEYPIHISLMAINCTTVHLSKETFVGSVSAIFENLPF